MRRAFTVSTLAIVLVLVGSTGLVRGDDKKGGKKMVTYASAEKAKFEELVPGVSKAVLWGDHDGGAYGAFTKLAPGFDAGAHTHSNDVWIVVLEGAYVYEDESGERRVEAGGFIRIPAGTKHRSGGDAEQGALFYEESSGAFDLVPAE